MAPPTDFLAAAAVVVVVDDVPATAGVVVVRVGFGNSGGGVMDANFFSCKNA